MIDPAQILDRGLGGAGFETLSAGPAASAPAERGTALGLQLEVMEDVAAELMDSMEELSAQFEEKTLKDVAQRKLGRPRLKAFANYARAIERWSRHFADLPSGEFIDRILKQLKQEKSVQMSPRELLKALARGSSDPSHLYALLDILEQALGEKEDVRLAALVKEAKKLLEKERGPEMRAGLNIAEEVNSRARSPEEMRALRDLYRAETLGFKGPQDCFRSLLASRGPARLGDALDFLVKSCGLDLQNPSPSQSPEELRRIILDLQCVNVLKAMMDDCSALVGKMPTLFGETSLLDGQQLAGRIADLTEKPFPAGTDISSLLASCGFAQLLAKIYFNTQLLELMRALSPRLFAEDGDRFKLLDAAQENLDGLVREEEAGGGKDGSKGGKERAA